MPGCSGVVWTVIRFCTSSRMSSGIARPKRTIIGMPTPTTAPSPRKLLTATVWPGLAMVVKVRSCGRGLVVVAGHGDRRRVGRAVVERARGQPGLAVGLQLTLDRFAGLVLDGDLGVDRVLGLEDDRRSRRARSSRRPRGW